MANSAEAAPTSPPGVGGMAASKVSTPGPVGEGCADVAVPQPASMPATDTIAAIFALIVDILPCHGHC
ncbi:hypothetical protein GCM10012289_03890 [Nonomuraea cavernae]|uniref:Uncharacterized protein n=1 Tax=Nonomuraea cavernae TaxID=2045107 RepID=A0A917YP72_9ACTN|nr:hypothetical protein GCM10012289_03890 [Nonomuraea cavernae]